MHWQTRDGLCLSHSGASLLVVCAPHGSKANINTFQHFAWVNYHHFTWKGTMDITRDELPNMCQCKLGNHSLYIYSVKGQKLDIYPGSN